MFIPLGDVVVDHGMNWSLPDTVIVTDLEYGFAPPTYEETEILEGTIETVTA
jgi:hypothetical protein